MFRKKTPQEAPALWIATQDLPATPATGFYQKLDVVLATRQFGEAVRALCTPFYDMMRATAASPGSTPRSTSRC